MIQIKNIVKNYLSGENEVHALKDISINFRNSEFVSILGPSGCGKTTLLNIIGGLDKYTSGDIVINGVSTKEYKDKDWDAYRNHYIGFVFQSYNLISHLSVLENVELALSIAGLNKSEKRKKAIKALKEVGLENQLKKKPNQLSGGQMQRVAIARAIVNEPKIILADEPTGALDSETSVQIMDILKKISDKYLIIMVTHNENIAKDYSTRIISILDGVIVGDTSPYNPTEEEITSDRDTYIKKSTKENEKKKIKKIKSSMNYSTSFLLSLKNLWSKKGKTIIESLAGSIGIIGIALVLAVSAGFNNYISNLQTNTLGSFPMSVSMIAVDYDSFTGDGLQDIGGSNKGDDNSFAVYNPIDSLTKYGHFNYFCDDFVNYINEFVTNDSKTSEDKRNIKHVRYDYGLKLNVLTKNKGVVTAISNSSTSSALMGTTSSSSLYELIDSKDWILENYDLIGKYSDSPNELMLVIGKNNKFDIEKVSNLGLPYTTTTSADDKIVYNNVMYNDVINNCEYALILNNAYYNQIGDTFDTVDLSKKPSNQANLLSLFNSAEDYVNDSSKSPEDYNILKMKISGILKAKDSTDTEILESGLVYNHKLSEFYKQNSENSDIANYAKDLINERISNGITGDDVYNIIFPWTYSVSVSELALTGIPSFKFNSTGSYIKDADNVVGMVEYVRTHMDKNITYEDAYRIALQTIGCSDIPFAIYFYPTSFDAKQNIINHIDSWNTSAQGSTNRIIYTDATEILTKSMGQLIDIISYVLIAFAGISLVVSSIMIGIITYTSVIERTKEIGVLRSIGARKKDISRIFNSETILIGLFAGLLGVLVSWILTFPISAIITSVADGAITTSMAMLKGSDALTLIIISTILTAIAGTVPAFIASKKDPVKCLRSD